MHPIHVTATLAALLALAGSALAGPLAGNNPALLLPKSQGTSPPPGVVQGGPNIAKANLTSLSLAQMVMPASNPTAVVFSLQGDRPVANCQLVYELHTNYTGGNVINVTLAGPLDIPNATGGFALPLQGQSLSFGTLMEGDHFRVGGVRLVLRAKSTPTNTCTGEVHADFQIKDASQAATKQSLASIADQGNARPVAAKPPQLTGFQLAADWYDFKNKRMALTILASGDSKMKCGYQVNIHSNTSGKDYPSGIQAQETIVPSLGTGNAVDLPVGNYTVTAVPYQGSDPRTLPCGGQASATGDVKMPANEMAITGGLLYVYSAAGAPNFAQSAMHAVTVTPDDVTNHRINYVATFKNTSNYGCTYVQSVTLPIGGTASTIIKIDGPSANTILHPWNNAYTYPGVYKIHLDGNVLAAGGGNPASLNQDYPPCAGSADLTVTVAVPLQKAPTPVNGVVTVVH